MQTFTTLHIQIFQYNLRKCCVFYHGVHSQTGSEICIQHQVPIGGGVVTF